MRTPHGVVQTPAFMPVGTQGAVKGVTHRDLDDLGEGSGPRSSSATPTTSILGPDALTRARGRTARPVDAFHRLGRPS